MDEQFEDFRPDIDENNLNEEGQDEEVYAPDNTDSYSDGYEETPYQAQTGDSTAPKAEDFDTYDEYEEALVDHRVDKKLSSAGMQGPSLEQQAINEAAARQNIGDIGDPAGRQKAEIIKNIEHLNERTLNARAQNDHRLAWRLQEQIHSEIKELERMPPSPLQKAAEESNVAEITGYFNNAQSNVGFIDSQIQQFGDERVLADSRIITRETTLLNDGDILAYLEGDSKLDKPLTTIHRSQFKTVKVDQAVADDIRQTIRNMPDANIYDLLVQRNLIPPPGQEEPFHEEEKSTRNPDLMTQKQYEQWRLKGGGKKSRASSPAGGTLPSGRKIKF